MNAPIIWIFIPILISAVLFIFRKRERLCAFLAGFISLFLATLALVLPIGEPIKLGTTQINLPSEFPILGRKFILGPGDGPILFLLYVIGAYWFFSSAFFKVRRIVVPIELGLIGLLVAALAVEPFLYTALIIEIAVIAMIPILINPEQIEQKGLLRYLIFQTLGMPFILLAGWFLASGEITPIGETQLIQSSLLLGLGFAFWLGVFPLYTWIPMMAEEAHPQVSGFVFSFLSLVTFLFLLNFLNNYAWLRDFAVIYPAFRWLGSIMILTGGVWSLFQDNVQKIFGFMVLITNGFLLMALGISGADGMRIFTNSLLPRMLSIALMSFSLMILNEDNSNWSVNSLIGLIREKPFVSAGIIVAVISVSGFPSLASFPEVYQLAKLISDFSPFTSVFLFFGELALFGTGIRLLSIMMQPSSNEDLRKEKSLERFVIISLIVLLLLFGLFPSFFSNFLSNLFVKFTFLLR